MNNSELMQRAREVIPGGVNSPVRAYGPVGGNPPFIQRGSGSRIWDANGREYIDFVGSWGPLILGHAQPDVVEAVTEAARGGTSYGAPTAAEVELARLVVSRVPSVDKVRLVNSGTEATMTALRLARGYTGRDKLIKFDGCYHGHADAFLVKAGSGAATLGTPTSPGVPPSVVADTLVADFNDIDSVRAHFEEHGEDIAAVIIEPVCGNSGVIPPADGFLETLRSITADNGALLIFDEVMTGFRVHMHSAQGRYGIDPDITTMGKVIGGGMPIGALGGKREIMDHLAPDGPVYQAGTLSGNPIAVAAGLATLRALEPATYEKLERLGQRLEEGIRENIAASSVTACFQRVGSMAALFFGKGPVTTGADAQACDAEMFAAYFHRMLEAGIYLPPSQFETFFLSTAHSTEDIDRLIEANRQALRTLAE